MLCARSARTDVDRKASVDAKVATALALHRMRQRDSIYQLREPLADFARRLAKDAIFAGVDALKQDFTESGYDTKEPAANPETPVQVLAVGRVTQILVFPAGAATADRAGNHAALADRLVARDIMTSRPVITALPERTTEAGAMEIIEALEAYDFAAETLRFSSSRAALDAWRERFPVLAGVARAIAMAELEIAGYRTPTSVFAHGFLTVNGQKMSKSRGTFIKARTYLEHLNPEYLRYYFAAKLGGGIDDLDLNLDDFIARVNADLVGKLVNIASRCAGFIGKRFDGKLSDSLPDPGLFAEFAGAADTIAGHYEQREYSKAIRIIMGLADEANRYIDDKKPWVIIKDESQLDDVQAVCTQGLNLFRSLMVYLTPVIPVVAEELWTRAVNTPPTRMARRYAGCNRIWPSDYS